TRHEGRGGFAPAFRLPKGGAPAGGGSAPLPFRPPAAQPGQHRLDVEPDHQNAERDHPEPEHRKKPDDPARDEAEAKERPRPGRDALTDPDEHPLQPRLEGLPAVHPADMGRLRPAGKPPAPPVAPASAIRSAHAATSAAALGAPEPAERGTTRSVRSAFRITATSITSCRSAPSTG